MVGIAEKGGKFKLRWIIYAHCFLFLNAGLAENYDCSIQAKEILDKCLLGYSGQNLVFGKETCLLYPDKIHGECEKLGIPVDVYCDRFATVTISNRMANSQCSYLQPGQAGSNELSEIEGITEDSGSSTIEASAGTSLSSLEADKRECYSAGQNALNICGSIKEPLPQKPLNGDKAGIRRYCEQLKNASLRAKNSNTSSFGKCTSSHTFCTEKCSNIKKKWEDRFAQCSSSGACSSSEISRIDYLIRTELPGMIKDSCKRGEDLAKEMSSGAADAYAAALRSNDCQRKAEELASSTDPKDPNADPPADTAATPEENTAKDDTSKDKEKSDKSEEGGGGGLGDALSGLAGMGGQQEEPSAQTAALQDDCEINPTLPGCGGAVDNFGDPGTPIDKTGGDGVSLDNFNTANTDGLPQTTQFNRVQPVAAQGRSIPNGGGSMPGGGGGGGSGFGGDDGGAAAGEASGARTDILQGLRSGGGSSSSSDPSAISGGGGFSGYASIDDFKNKFKAMDLKQYLPGGKKDPNRQIASLKSTGTGHPDISPMGESMFKRVSTKLSLMCKMKQLIGCE